MRHVLLVLMCLAVAWSATAQPVTRTIPFGGLTRSFVIHAPARAQEQDRALVVVLHGMGGSGANALEQGRWATQADKEGFIVVAPEGLAENPDRPARFFGNRRSWNSGPATGSPAQRRGTDDVGFIGAVIADVRRTHRVDSRRIHVTGFSNGAAMAFRMGAERADIIASIAPVANGLLVPVAKLPRPVSLYLVWGAADPLNPMAGGKVERAGQTIERPSAEASWRRWAALLNCPGTPSRDRPAPDVTRQAFAGCDGGSTASFVSIDGLGHQWPGGRTYLRIVSGPGSDAFDATGAIWAFFKTTAR